MRQSPPGYGVLQNHQMNIRLTHAGLLRRSSHHRRSFASFQLATHSLLQRSFVFRLHHNQQCILHFNITNLAVVYKYVGFLNIPRGSSIPIDYRASTNKL